MKGCVPVTGPSQRCRLPNCVSYPIAVANHATCLQHPSMGQGCVSYAAEVTSSMTACDILTHRVTAFTGHFLAPWMFVSPLRRINWTEMDVDMDEGGGFDLNADPEDDAGIVLILTFHSMLFMCPTQSLCR